MSFGDMPVILDELCPLDQAFILNPAFLSWKPDERISGISTPLSANTLTEALRTSQSISPQIMVVHPTMAHRLWARLEQWVQLPADVDGTMRCPTCFRRLRRYWVAEYSYRCPSRRCPLAYEITDRQLASR